ncbi:MAG: MFS transporter [Pseudomonadota bacterium]
MIRTPISAALRQLLIAQVPADFADWLDFVAIGALLAYVWMVDPMVFAVLAVAMGLPYLIIGPVAGVVVDRSSVKSVLILSNLGRALATAALFLAPSWPVLMVIVALRATVDTFYTPAKQAAIQALTTKDDRTRVNGLSHAINQASKIVAPALGGGLLIWLSPQHIFAINALVSVLAALLLWTLPVIFRDIGTSDAELGLRQNLSAGMDVVRSSPVLRAALIMMGAGYFAMFFYDTLIAPLTRDLGYTETILGLSLAAVGAGGVLGALALGAGPADKQPFVMIGIGSGIAALIVMMIGGFEVTGQKLSHLAFIGLFGLLGFCSAMTVVPFRTIIQNNVSSARIGRVTALSEAVNTIALLTAPFVGAAIASAFSIGASFICGGVVMLLVAIRAMQLRALR